MHINTLHIKVFLIKVKTTYCHIQALMSKRHLHNTDFSYGIRYVIVPNNNNNNNLAPCNNKPDAHFSPCCRLG